MNFYIVTLITKTKILKPNFLTCNSPWTLDSLDFMTFSRLITSDDSTLSLLVLEGLITRVILVLRSSPVESNLRVESQPSALHDVKLRLRILNIQLDMLTAGRPPQGADTGGDQSQQQRGEHDWERLESVVMTEITCPAGSSVPLHRKPSTINKLKLLRPPPLHIRKLQQINRELDYVFSVF